MERIKGLRKKQNEAFNSLIPFGTDGILVDMLSGLDAEQELKIGGNHTTTIGVDPNNEDITVITENYLDLTNQNVYTVVTTIQEIESTSEPEGSDPPEVTSYTQIDMSLIKNNETIRHKVINISSDESSTTIEEELASVEEESEP